MKKTIFLIGILILLGYAKAEAQIEIASESHWLGSGGSASSVVTGSMLYLATVQAGGTNLATGVGQTPPSDTSGGATNWGTSPIAYTRTRNAALNDSTWVYIWATQVNCIGAPAVTSCSFGVTVNLGAAGAVFANLINVINSDSAPVDVYSCFYGCSAITVGSPTNNPTAPQIYTNYNNELLFSIFGSGDMGSGGGGGTPVFTPLSGWTEVHKEQFTGLSYFSASRITTPTGGYFTGGIQSTVSSDMFAGIVIGIKEAGTAGGSTGAPPGTTTTTTTTTSTSSSTSTTAPGATTTTTTTTTTTIGTTSTTIPCPGIRMSMKGELDCYGALKVNPAYNLSADVGDSFAIQQGFLKYNFIETTSGTATTISHIIPGLAATSGLTFNMTPVVREIDAICSSGTGTVSVYDNLVAIWKSADNEVTTSRYVKQFPAGGLSLAKGHDMKVELSSCGGGNTGKLQVIGDSSP